MLTSLVISTLWLELKMNDYTLYETWILPDPHANNIKLYSIELHVVHNRMVIVVEQCWTSPDVCVCNSGCLLSHIIAVWTLAYLERSSYKDEVIWSCLTRLCSDYMFTVTKDSFIWFPTGAGKPEGEGGGRKMSSIRFTVMQHNNPILRYMCENLVKALLPF